MQSLSTHCAELFARYIARNDRVVDCTLWSQRGVSAEPADITLRALAENQQLSAVVFNSVSSGECAVRAGSVSAAPVQRRHRGSGRVVSTRRCAGGVSSLRDRDACDARSVGAHCVARATARLRRRQSRGARRARRLRAPREQRRGRRDSAVRHAAAQSHAAGVHQGRSARDDQRAQRRRRVQAAGREQHADVAEISCVHARARARAEPAGSLLF